MPLRRRRRVPRRKRPRSTPKWLLKSEDVDRLAKQRCLMVLNVLSGEVPVTEAIAVAGISRGSYYQLETRALNAMLRSLQPGASPEAEEAAPLRQIAALELKVKQLEKRRRRMERLLLLTRKLVTKPMLSKTRLARTSSTPSGRVPLRNSTKAESRPLSTLTPTGAAEP